MTSYVECCHIPMWYDASECGVAEVLSLVTHGRETRRL
jgi:hypothetical protein